MSIEVAASLALAQRPISQELKAAEGVQTRLLSRTTPQLSTLQFGAACAPARCIGGDDGQVMRKRYYRTMPVNIGLDRNFMGLRALMYKLKARADWGPNLRQRNNGEAGRCSVLAVGAKP